MPAHWTLPCWLAATLFAASASTQAATYAIDPLRTSTTYELGSISSGRFERHTGTIELDLAAKTGLADVSIEAASVRSGTPLVDAILASSELFNASQYPSIHFLGDRFLFSGETLTGVLGNLTLLGKTLPVLLQVNHFACRTPPAPEPEVCSGSFETTIDRTDYGMDLGVSLGMPKSVHLVVQVEAVRQ
ncbi:YceI family protein [Rhodoferax sp. WC2427]|uniref:YceI family protein n=1 Tax=Rhodoferax sp. WC2427 TaxID=3234144 RepID=UPI0034669BAD